MYRNLNDENRQHWLKQQLDLLPKGAKILDAGAGELRNKGLCTNLQYVSQDFCEYDGQGDGEGLQTGEWQTDKVDIVCDIADIPEEDNSFDAILCSEVLEHIPSPEKALDEFSRLLKKGGTLILTAPFVSVTHFAPYHYCTGFSRYWYEHHLPTRELEKQTLDANGDWFDLLAQELTRLGSTSRLHKEPLWPISYLVSFLAHGFLRLRPTGKSAENLGCFGWHVVATKA